MLSVLKWPARSLDLTNIKYVWNYLDWKCVKTKTITIFKRALVILFKIIHIIKYTKNSSDPLPFQP